MPRRRNGVLVSLTLPFQRKRDGAEHLSGVIGSQATIMTTGMSAMPAAKLVLDEKLAQLADCAVQRARGTCTVGAFVKLALMVRRCSRSAILWKC
jgi:hypothetical protein